MVALAKDGHILFYREEKEGLQHAENVHAFAASILQQSGLGFGTLDAIAVSMGPGSFTGLRIGVSAAKGFCMALDIPLIGLPTFEVMAAGAIQSMHQFGKAITTFFPMLDARRMEVYSAGFDASAHLIFPVGAYVLDQPETLHSFHQKFRNVEGNILVFGPGAFKLKCSEDLLQKVEFSKESFLLPGSMAAIAEHHFQQKKFRNVDSFEPFYLKDFYVPSKS